jgi:hypothetical protein
MSFENSKPDPAAPAMDLNRFKLTKGRLGEIELRWLDDDGDWMFVVEISPEGKLVRNINLCRAAGHPFVLKDTRIAEDIEAIA